VQVFSGDGLIAKNTSHPPFLARKTHWAWRHAIFEHVAMIFGFVEDHQFRLAGPMCQERR
jgi:hypothetical protein